MSIVGRQLIQQGSQKRRLSRLGDRTVTFAYISLKGKDSPTPRRTCHQYQASLGQIDVWQNELKRLSAGTLFRCGDRPSVGPFSDLETLIGRICSTKRDKAGIFWFVKESVEPLD